MTFSDLVTNIPAICNEIGAELTEFAHDNQKISGNIVRNTEIIPFEIYSVPGADDKCDIAFARYKQVREHRRKGFGRILLAFYL